jgi:hypothetical protein|tara:strand:- start:21 stop:317 length:297 start_codon:yes stop_codon:yes gene_type:complete
MKATDLLKEAADIVGGPRNKTHGDIDECFSLAARFWSLYLGVEVRPRQVSRCQELFKIVREVVGSPGEPDHYLDSSAYAAIAGHLYSTFEGEEENGGS